MEEILIGKCGICCSACPTYIKGECKGCIDEHQDGDCFSRDCCLKKGLKFCGECKDFPCETIMNKPKCTAIDKAWLLWKKNSK